MNVRKQELRVPGLSTDTRGVFAFCRADYGEVALIRMTCCTVLYFSTSEMFLFRSSGI